MPLSVHREFGRYCAHVDQWDMPRFAPNYSLVSEYTFLNDRQGVQMRTQAPWSCGLRYNNVAFCGSILN